MSFPRILLALFLLALQPCAACAAGQGVGLTRDSEDGFRRLIHMAESGQLGDDVTTANVGVEGHQVRIELVRTGAPSKVLVLTKKTSNQEVCRYFDIVPAAGATAGDVERVGKVLDAIFPEDPFQVPGLEESRAQDPIPELGEAWTYGGWRGVLGVLERRMASLASVRYTCAVIGVLALATLASLALLWASIPPAAPER
jgi:hypothetical protein